MRLENRTCPVSAYVQNRGRGGRGHKTMTVPSRFDHNRSFRFLFLGNVVPVAGRARSRLKDLYSCLWCLTHCRQGWLEKRAGHLVLWFVLTYCSFVLDCWFFGSGASYTLKSRHTKLSFRMSIIPWWMSSLPVVQFRMPRSRTAIAARAGRVLCSLVLVRRT